MSEVLNDTVIGIREKAERISRDLKAVALHRARSFQKNHKDLISRGLTKFGEIKSEIKKAVDASHA